MAETAGNNRKSRHGAMRIIVVEALLVTLLAHGALLLLFEYRPTTAPAGRGRRAGIRLLNLGAVSEDRAGRAMRWLDIHDPSHVVRADSPYAPAARLNVPERPRPADLPRRDVTAAPAPRQPAAPVLPEPPPPATARLATAEPETVLPELPERRYPTARLNGRSFDFPFDPAMLELSRAANADRTEIELSPAPDGAAATARFAIRRRSGSNRLDLLTVRRLLAMPGLAAPDKRAEIVIVWRREGETS